MEPGPGRPSIYNKAVEMGAIEEILDRLADGETLTSICKSRPEFPVPRTLRRWAADPDHEFSPQYARAREIGYQRMADELLDIADDGQNDWMETNDPENPGWKFNGEASARSRLRLDTRKWLLSKALPKIYGEKTQMELSGKDGAPLTAVLNVTIGSQPSSAPETA